MKENTKIRLIYVAIGVVVAIITAYSLWQNRKECWHEYARKAFVEVLKTELQKREMKDVPYFSWGVRSSYSPKDTLQNDSLKEVTVTTAAGKKTYRIPAFKFDRNIEDDPRVCMLHSYILEMHPLEADSLNLAWTKSLQEMGFSGKNIVKVSVVNLLEHEIEYYSGDSLVVNEADCLFRLYIGYRCEVEVSGFLYLPWWKTFFLKDIVLLSCIVMICFLFPFLSKRINRFYRTSFVKTEVVTIEKQIPVIVPEKSGRHIYQLDPGVFFDYDSRQLRRDDKIEALTPQTANLLKLFLEADDYLLTVDEIAKAFWPDTMDAKNNIYTAIKNLRKSLSCISRCTVDNKNLGYQLIIPDSNEEKA